MLKQLLKYSSVYEASRRLIGAEAEMRHLVDNVIKPWDEIRVLDIGCGNGRLVPFLPNAQYVGVDHNESYIKAATEKWSNKPNVRFVCGDLEGRSHEFGDFDVVVSLGVLHHLDDSVADDAIRSASRCLAADGRLITMDPCFEPEQLQIARVLMALDRGKFVRHPSDYERLILRHMKRCEGVTVNSIYKFPYTHFVTESWAG
jgi:SAM-dependent methyltransferase